MRKELIDEVNDYIYFINNVENEHISLLGYDELDEEPEDYSNLYEGGNYVYDELLNKYYYIYFKKGE